MRRVWQFQRLSSRCGTMWGARASRAAAARAATRSSNAPARVAAAALPAIKNVKFRFNIEKRQYTC